MSAHRILVIDDEERLLKAWSKALRYAGYSVFTATTSQEALRLCQETPFDLVIVDLIMPSMTGVELLQRIRQQLSLVRSIMVSGKIDDRIDPRDIHKSLREAVEADVYLHKPVSNDQLISYVKDLLQKDPPTPNWKDIASRALTARKATIQKAKATAKELKRLTKKKK